MSRKREEAHILWLRGSKTSFAALIACIRAKEPLTDVIFVDSTKEFPEVLKVIDLAKQICKENDIAFHHLSYDWYGYFKADSRIEENGLILVNRHRGWPNKHVNWERMATWRVIWDFVYKRYNENDTIFHYHDRHVGRKRRTGRKSPTSYYSYPYLVVYPLKEYGLGIGEVNMICKEFGDVQLDHLLELHPKITSRVTPMQGDARLFYIWKERQDIWNEILELDKGYQGRYGEYPTALVLDGLFESVENEVQYGTE